jgi:hypothetical protein
MKVLTPIAAAVAGGAWLVLAFAHAAVADIEGYAQGWELIGPFALTIAGVALLGAAAWVGPRGHPREAGLALVGAGVAFILWLALIA